MKISFLGLGRMGAILAEHLVDDGHDVIVWNRSIHAAERLGAHGATVAASSDLALTSAPVVVTVLFGPEAIEDVVLGSTGTWQPDTVWIDVTTVSPDDTRIYADWAAERGIRYVHSPVVGTLGPARARALGVILGGDPGAVAVARPVVETWADADRISVFDTPAQAATAKLIANLGLAVAMQGVVEALRLGQSEGLDLEQVLRSLDKTMLGPTVAAKGATLRDASFASTQFSADLLAKDVGLMIATAAEPMPATTAAWESLLWAQRRGRGDDDFSVIAATDD
ncbi:NAD(P)-dependent oxidoreductase [Aeromicrobium wangtongii]|uniref:NAD(P)-dependent oxidoreductase n=1 Tax=Aeromicrobium wangtongii TaxID=2969247 RepID=UPI002016D24C|nr:NAD(P)-dependent oxidoreductase [Aeromicrobium wangtongii]MCL3820036.1 NAD(P)-dependent oxidoreductase [Aeromicrobium wangtongii]